MSFGKALVIFGAVVIAIGLLMELAPNLKLGRLPGDISFGGQNWRVYIPLGTSLVLSVILTLAFAIAGNLSRR